MHLKVCCHVWYFFSILCFHSVICWSSFPCCMLCSSKLDRVGWWDCVFSTNSISCMMDAKRLLSTLFVLKWTAMRQIADAMCYMLYAGKAVWSSIIHCRGVAYLFTKCRHSTDLNIMLTAPRWMSSYHEQRSLGCKLSVAVRRTQTLAKFWFFQLWFWSTGAGEPTQKGLTPVSISGVTVDAEKTSPILFLLVDTKKGIASIKLCTKPLARNFKSTTN